MNQLEILAAELPNPQYRDCGIHELAPQEMQSIAESARSWFCTHGFATLYSNATRVLIMFDRNRQISQASFYTIEKSLGAFRRLSFVAPFKLDREVLQELIAKHRAQYANIRLFTREALDETAVKESYKVTRYSEDAVVKLPSSLGEYLSGLGRQTRKHLPYYRRRLEREWGARLAYVILAKRDISFEQFERLVQLNQMRVERKGSRSGWTQRLVENRWKMAQDAGLLIGICLDGNLVAGTLSYLHGGEAYLVLIAHHPEYDFLNIGNISLFCAIERLIGLKCHAFHLLWGQGFYKSQFGAQEIPFFEVTFLRRSAFALFLWTCLSMSHRLAAHLRTTLRPVLQKVRTARINSCKNSEAK